MVDLPELNTDGAVEEAKEQGKRLIPWLPDPHRCECGALCDADRQFVREQGVPMDVWVCPECNRRFYRDEDETLF